MLSSTTSSSSRNNLTPVRNRSVDDADLEETSSLVGEEQIIHNNKLAVNEHSAKGVFRDWDQHEIAVPAGMGPNRHSSRPTSPQQQQQQLQQPTTTITPNTTHSRHSSLDLLDSDWEEDEATLRRYNLNIPGSGGVDLLHGSPDDLYLSGSNGRSNQNSNNNNNNGTNTSTTYSNGELLSRNDQMMLLPSLRHYWSIGRQRWRELRQAARQRRAVRLLTMPSESVRYQCQACLISWCCDATDVGIFLTAAWLAVWLIMGCWTHRGTAYWLAGLLLFVLRVTARRCYEGGWCCTTTAAASVLSRAQAQRRRRGRRLGQSSFRPLDGSHTEEDHSDTAMTDHHHNSNTGSGNGVGLDGVASGSLDNWTKDSNRSGTLPTAQIKEKNSNRDLSIAV